MGMSITHFMWGYQPHFRISQAGSAERVFQALDKRFKPEVFLVGSLAEPREDCFQACVEPEDDFWISSEEFNQVCVLSETLKDRYPEAQLRQSLPIAQQRQDEHLLKRSIQDAIKQLINSHPSKPSDLAYSVSLPSKVGSYWVCVVLGLQDNIVKTYSSLKKSSFALHEYRQIPVATSLIDATVHEFLEHAATELRKPDPGLETGVADTDELLRYAGNRLMMDVALRVDNNCLQGPHILFRACTTVSSLRYEQSAGTGGLLLAAKDHPSVTKKVEFAQAKNLTRHRAVRKLLELASEEVFLHTDSEGVYGLSTLETYEPDREDVFEVHILGHHDWELRHAGHPLMRVKYGLPALPVTSFDEQKLRLDLPRIFKGITDEEIDALVNLVIVAESESHGTMLVITEEAGAEVERLSVQGTAINPCPLTPDLLRHLTPIDGAVVLSPQGVCYGIGIILDGKATNKGDAGRGARFNSAMRYVESSPASCLAIVVSEDGGIDFIPNLRPAISRQKIDRTILGIRTLMDAEKINVRIYRSLLDWLDEHRFYLKQEDCNALNAIVPHLENRINSESRSSVWVHRREFIQHPEMDEVLYYTHES